MRAAVVTLIASALVSGCKSPVEVLDPDSRDTAVVDCASLSSSFATEDSMQQPVAVFIAGETITLHARVTNNGSTALTLHGDTCPNYSFEIKDESGNAVWEWGSDTVNVPLTSCADSYTLAPGETSAPAIDWNQGKLVGGAQVPAGQYTAYSRDSTECGDTLGKSVDFEIQ